MMTHRGQIASILRAHCEHIACVGAAGSREDRLVTTHPTEGIASGSPGGPAKCSSMRWYRIARATPPRLLAPCYRVAETHHGARQLSLCSHLRGGAVESHVRPMCSPMFSPMSSPCRAPNLPYFSGQRQRGFTVLVHQHLCRHAWRGGAFV